MLTGERATLYLGACRNLGQFDVLTDAGNWHGYADTEAEA